MLWRQGSTLFTATYRQLCVVSSPLCVCRLCAARCVRDVKWRGTTLAPVKARGETSNSFPTISERRRLTAGEREVAWGGGAANGKAIILFSGVQKIALIRDKETE